MLPGGIFACQRGNNRALEVPNLDLPHPELKSAPVCLASKQVKGPAMLRAGNPGTEDDAEVLDVKGYALRERERLVGASLQVRLEPVTRVHGSPTWV